MNRLLRRVVTPGIAATLLATAALWQAHPLTSGPDGTDPLGTAARARASVPDLDWSACGADQCATTQVPLDHDAPGGSTVTLALKKVPASAPDQRAGSLFLDLGGPGVAATEGTTFATAVAALPAEVRKTYDVIGVDPRGSGGSTPVGCGPAPGQDPVPAPPRPYPESGEEIQARNAYDAYLRASCDSTAGPVLDHMSIADIARDLDLIRQAVGDEKLTFYGMSYGSLLGQTYAALFPDRVRAMVLDGVLDPVAATTGRPGDDRPVSQRNGQPPAMEEALAAALRTCDSASVRHCPLTGLARHRWQRVDASLAAEPLEVAGQPFDDRQFRLLTLAAFQYEHLGGLPLPTVELLTDATRVIEYLRFTYAGQSTVVHPPGEDPIDLRAPEAELKSRLAGLLTRIAVPPTPPPPDDISGGQARMLGTLCADSVNPADPADWADAADASAGQAPHFGRLMTWAYSACAAWPGSATDAYHGPFDTALATPPLLVGNTRDGATPLAGARAAQALHTGSRLVTLDGWGHTAIGKSACVSDLVRSYLVDQELPDGDPQCKPDDELFDGR